MIGALGSREWLGRGDVPSRREPALGNIREYSGNYFCGHLG